jgi:uncharacterized protein (TIGR00295 family)
MSIPRRDECLQMLRLEGVPWPVVKHVETVEAIALAIARAINAKHPNSVNERLVTAGALLHDLGRARTHDIRHALEGVTMAEEIGLDPRIVEIIRRHVGGGLTAPEARQLGLPAWDGVPHTIEEKIVCHADTLTDANGRRTLKQALKHIETKGSPMYTKRVKELHNFLSGLAEEDVDLIGPW